jgi:hypothetical protein
MEWGSALQAVEATLELEKTVRVLYFPLKGLCHKIFKFIAAIMEWGWALQAVEATLELEKTVRVLYFPVKGLCHEMYKHHGVGLGPSGCRGHSPAREDGTYFPLKGLCHKTVKHLLQFSGSGSMCFLASRIQILLSSCKN